MNNLNYIINLLQRAIDAEDWGIVIEVLQLLIEYDGDNYHLDDEY